MLLHFHNPSWVVHPTTSTISTKNQFLYFSQFSHPYSTLPCSQNHHYNTHYHSLSLFLSNFSPFSFYVQPSQKSIPKLLSLPQPLSQFGLHQGTRELGSLVTTDTVLIFPFFLRLWTGITGFTIFLIAQAQKMCVLKVVVSDKDASNRNGKPFSHPFLIPSSYCYYFHTILIPSQELTFVWEPFF